MNQETEKLIEQSLPILKELLQNPQIVSALAGKKIDREVIQSLERELSYSRELRQLHERMKATQKREQDLCPHIAGLGNFKDFHNRTCINWHQLDTGEVVGICLECGRQFWPQDPDYWIWIEKASFCRPSSAGKNRGADLRGLLDQVSYNKTVDLWNQSQLEIEDIALEIEDTEPDPWLLDKYGNPDCFARVDFSGDLLDKFWSQIEKEAKLDALPTK